MNPTLIGATSGSFSVSDAGAATYSIPIIVSPGTAGMQPSISLNYSSAGGNGVMGLGWSVLGISTIQRSGKTLAQDGVVDAVSFDANDTYSLDGERLVLINGSFGLNNSEYRTEQNVLLKITAKGNTPGYASPEWFEVRTKAGLIMEYGRTADSRIEAQGTNTIMFWCVSKIMDTKGNYMTFTYDENSPLGEYYPKRIDYTGNTAAGLQPYNSVIFNYQNRIDDTPRYVNGTRISAAKILTSLDCFHAGSLARRYNFEYQTGAYTRISLLKSIQECGTHPFECLPPTQFTYESENGLGFTPVSGDPIPAADLNSGDNRLLQGDWNGDGRTDFLRHNTSTGGNTFYRNNANFNFTTNNPIPTNELDNGYLRVLDANSDGYSDIWWINWIDGANTLYLNNKTSTPSFTGYPAISAGELQAVGNEVIDIRLADWNGDGRVDIMTYLASTGRNRFFLNNTGTTGAPVFTLYGSGDLISPALISTSATDTKLELVAEDWNNDGLTDFLWTNRNAGNAAASHRWLRNTGNGQTLSFALMASLSNVNLRGGTGINLGDWNGDGQTDLMWHNDADGDSRWWTNKGNFTFLDAAPTITAGSLSGSGLQLYPVDFNGDGASDLVTYNKSSGTNHWFLNDGKLDFSKALNPNAPNQPGYLNPIAAGSLSNATALQFGAFSGKGGLDLLYVNTSLASSNNRWFETAIKPHYLIKKVVNGQGLTTTITYKPLTEPGVYTKEKVAVYPEYDFASGMQVVSGFEVDNGIGGKTRMSYTYMGGKTDLHGRGFRGFTEIHQKDEVTGIIASRYYERDHRYISAPLMRSETRLANGQIISETTYRDTLIAYYNGKAYASYTIATESRDYELDGSLVSVINNRMRYNDYGNVLYNVVDYGDGHIDSTWNSYTDDYNKWYTGRLVRAEMHRKAPSQPWTKRTVVFTYNAGDGLLTGEITEPDLPAEQQIVKTYTYDAFGNITQSKTTFHNGDQFETRTTTTTFDNQGRFTLSVSNQLGHTKTTQYDPMLGHPVSETDANGLTVTYEYDPIGRLTKVNFPDGNWSSSAYEDCTQPGCPPNSVFCVVARSSVDPEERSYYDVLGREVMTRTLGFDSTVLVKKSEFNNRGLLSRVSAPHFIHETPVWTVFKYDTLGRETEVIAPGNRVTKTLYSGLTISLYNPLNQTTIVRKNVPGRVEQVTDNANKTIRYTYDSNGNLLKTTDPNGNEIVNTYDIYSNKTSSKDPDMGAYVYVYNTIGEIKRQTNPKGQVTAFQYDALGRMTRRDEPEGQTNWTYDAKPYGLGMISSIQAPGYMQEVFYDSLSRVSRQTESFDGQDFAVEHYYDAKGRPASLHYPGGFSIKYLYNNQNYLTEVRNNATGQSFWKADQINARDQLVQQTLGNGTVCQNTFDANTFWLKKTQTFSGATKIQDLSYTYNNLGMLTQRANALPSKTENFTYDNLNRLLTSATAGGSTLQMTYDALGNITGKSDIGNYFYGENGAGPHQLTRVAVSNANNCIPSLTTDFTFTSFNKVKGMENDSARLEIDYGPGRNRVVQRQYLDSALAQTKYYIGNLFERIVTDTGTRNLYYIHAMGGVVAVHSTFSNGSAETEYWHKDHLGSVQTISNQQGQVVEALEYDAWGKRQKKAGPGSHRSDRGFTGHEHLDLFDLVNMNGRMYDPVLGRFISPDPFIQDPLNLQNLNRYAYVLNSPLSYTDPSGFWGISISFGGAKLKISHKGVKAKVSGDPKDWVKGVDVNNSNPTNRLIDKADKQAAKAFGQENWNTMKVTAAVIAVSVATAGVGTGIAPAILSGAAGGFVGGYAGASLAGADGEAALQAGLKGAVIGAVTATATYGVGDLADNLMGGGSGAYESAAWSGQKLAVYGVKVIAHGTVQGAASEANGGKFEHGFLSGAFSAGASPLVAQTPENMAVRTLCSATVGGTASQLGGGKFSNGAISGTMVYLLNCAAHAGPKPSQGVTASDVLSTKSTAAGIVSDYSTGALSKNFGALGDAYTGASVAADMMNDDYQSATSTVAQSLVERVLGLSTARAFIFWGVIEPSSIGPEPPPEWFRSGRSGNQNDYSPK